MAKPRYSFKYGEYDLLREAVDVSEEAVSEYYRFSEDFWLNHGRYEIRTLVDLNETEIVDDALAQIVKCHRSANPSHRPGFVYRICLQDHTITDATVANALNLMPLLAYVVVHELIHVVRFARHDQLFEARKGARLEEEKRVHGLTERLLSPLGLQGLDDVLSYTAPTTGGVLVESNLRGRGGLV